MKRCSFRWRLMLPTLALAGVVAAALVALVHARTRAQLRRSLENTLGTKSEEVLSVLDAGEGRVELESFLALESSYRNSPFEYFYELVAPDGRVLARSENVAPGRLGAPPARSEVAEFVVRPHPRREGQEVLVRTQRLPERVQHRGVPGPTVHVGVCLAPCASASRADLGNSLIAAFLSVGVLGATLWVVIGRSLRSVSAITRHASAISCSNLRERLPRNGSGDELDRLSEVLNGLFAGLESSLSQMEAFTSDAAHQMRTPLTRIRGELDLVLANTSGLAPETRARLEETRLELERLVHTCARLLLLARLDRGALGAELRADELDLAFLVQELVEQVAPLAADKGVEVVLGRASRARLRCCRALVAEALLNLLDNAIRCTPARGRVEVTVASEGGQALVTVSDTGPGIPLAEHELVFRRFFRGPNGVGGGTGLGLAIVRGIARAHGGEVALQSSVGQGAAFQMRLPAA